MATSSTTWRYVIRNIAQLCASSQYVYYEWVYSKKKSLLYKCNILVHIRHNRNQALFELFFCIVVVAHFNLPRRPYPVYSTSVEPMLHYCVRWAYEYHIYVLLLLLLTTTSNIHIYIWCGRATKRGARWWRRKRRSTNRMLICAIYNWRVFTCTSKRDRAYSRNSSHYQS